MSRGAVGKGPVTLGLGAVLGGLAFMAVRPEPLPPGLPPVAIRAPATSALIVAPVPAPTPEAPTQGPDRTPPARLKPADMPYRFIGQSAPGTETAIVLFGRGRVVTLHGPGPLDDEYVVEAVFDDYLVLRHVPTGAGQFLALTRRQAVVQPPRDPEDLPRD
jgi:hypothetical protein